MSKNTYLILLLAIPFITFGQLLECFKEMKLDNSMYLLLKKEKKQPKK